MLRPWHQTRSIFLALAGFVYSLAPGALSQTLKPADVGVQVNGFQDDFDGSTLNSAWMVHGASVYTLDSGALRVASASGDPNHLLYALPGYNDTTQEILARLRILNFGTGDAPRCGLVVGASTTASPAGGVNFLFRDHTSENQVGRHIAMLDDLRAWGPGYTGAFINNTWYWVRLRQEPNAQGGANDVFAKFWRADGTEAEPAGWQMSWDYIPTRTARNGFAGLTASSSGGLAEFEVDYVLIKASGLPVITVNPSAFPAFQLPVSITNGPADITVDELQNVVLNVQASGFPPLTYQWYKNGEAIPFATQAALYLAAVPLADDLAQYQVVVQNVASNVAHSATSRVATVRVSPDLQAPQLVSAHSQGPDGVLLTFSEPLSDSATLLENYSVISTQFHFVQILSAVSQDNGRQVRLSVSPLETGMGYVVTLNNLRDRAAAANAITPFSQTIFIATSLWQTSLEDSHPEGTVAWLPEGYRIGGGGSGGGLQSDEGMFAWTPHNDDFDLRVRVASLDPTDIWAKAGLMARTGEDVSATFAAALATPGLGGCFFLSGDDGALQTAGRYPANYPETWLRLQRQGDTLAGYASRDGAQWTLLGKVTLELPQTLLVGYLVSSHQPGALAQAVFQDFGNVTTSPPAASVAEPETMGPSSRRTGLVISEIMYHPMPHPATTNSLEFIELANTRAEPEDISGYRLSGDISYTFPAGTVLPGGGFLVVARFPADVEQVYGLAGALGPFTNNLPNNAGTVRLRHRTGAVLLEVKYGTQPPWPAAADGPGHSLVLVRPSQGENQAAAWTASAALGGSPGRWDPVIRDPLQAVVVNEFLANSAGIIGRDYIELHNRSAEPLDISGCTLSDSADTNKFTLPTGTLIAARSFLWLGQFDLGFPLKGGGDTLYFRHPDGRVLDAVRYGPQATEIAYGRYPDGGSLWSELRAQTPGTANAPELVRDVVINEIMYAPISGSEDDQYLELYNKGTNLLDISGWWFVDGISFQFPQDTFLAPDGYLLVAKNLTNLLAKYPHLNATNAVGNFTGSLSGSGERVALALFEASLITNDLALPMPPSVAPPPPPSNVIIDPTTNPQAFVVVDEVTYNVGGRWGRWSQGGGSSLELMDPRSDNRLAANWADSDESTKAPWTTVSRTGILDLGNVTADSVQILPLGAGEWVVDDVAVLNASSQNLVPNSTFATGLSGWVAEGALSGSAWGATNGLNGGGGLLVRAVDRGDNQINRVRASLSSSLAANTTATLQAKVRWLRGHPEMLLRLRGNWLEAATRLELPPGLGTPGLPNSRRVNNAPPAIHQVNHHPVLPAAGQSVVVTARASDPDGVTAINLHYRLDPATNFTAIAMHDDGLDGDAAPGDGLFAATIPGQSAGALVAFFVSAIDNHPAPTASRFPADAPARECLVRFGESTPPGTFPVYRLWMTQATHNRWTARHKLDNTPNDITFVLNDQRVIYNAEAQFAGSPYIAPSFNNPAGNRCGYSLSFPADDRLFGARDLVLDWPGGHGGENTAVQEQMAYAIAEGMGLPFSHRHFIRLHVNSVTDMQRGGVFEAVLQPAGDYLEQWSPDAPEGDFYKIDRAFEFDDNGNRVADPMPRLQNFTSGGQKKTERYRWTWLKRSYDSALDYSPLFAVVDALNATSPEPYTSTTERLVDVEQWMGIFAFEHIINNFDSWGHEIGKNMYMFRPAGGKWVLYPFDLDWLMLVSPRYSGNYANGNGSLFISEDPTVTRLYNHPPFRRAYLRAVQRAVNGPMRPEVAHHMMDAKYQSLLANGITLCDGQALANPAAVKEWFAQRRNYLQSQVDAASAAFDLSATNLSTTNNFLAISGTAPLEVTTILVNGTAWKPAWLSVSNWSIRVPLTAATNTLAITGVNGEGGGITATQAVTAIYAGQAPDPVGNVAFSELMFLPDQPGAEYIELHNAATNYTFDLSHWRINGLGYRFPAGTALLPGQYLVLAKDFDRFAAAYGAAVPVFDSYPGNLQTDGETLTLLRPGVVAGSEDIVAQVRYEAALPWPTNSTGGGSALQLRHPQQDQRRVLNWSGDTEWQFKSLTVTNLITVTFTNLHLRTSGAGEIYLDNLRVEEGSTWGAGSNLVVNGDFEAPLEGTWTLGPMVTQSARSDTVRRAGQYSLRLTATGRVQIAANSIYQPLVLKTGAVYTISFWYLPNPSITNVELYVTPYSRASAPTSVAAFQRSPGTNNLTALALPSLPPVWLSEVQPENAGAITNEAGQMAPWLELYNSGTQTVSLAGWGLADNYSYSNIWKFPEQALLQPGERRLIWCDGQPELTTAAHWHTHFTLTPGTGSVALMVPVYGTPGIMDYLNYTGLEAGQSYGNYPDDQPVFRRIFHYVTPAGTNNPALPPTPVVINEWMADNTSAVADPADQNYEDWFELYNYSGTTVDLSGYWLTDNLNNPFQFRIPAGVTLAPYSFLLVWADNESPQYAVGDTNLHVSFALSKNGESIGLFAPDGSLVDSVQFGLQQPNQSSGRFPDGDTSAFYALPQPTPAAPNAQPGSGNQPPFIDQVPDQSLVAGQPLLLHILAGDPDWPPQILTFRLGAGAPTGMAVSPDGYLTWTPALDAPMSNRVQIIVRDDGVPNLSATNSLTIYVAGPPEVKDIRWLAGGTVFALEFAVVPGKRYQLEYSSTVENPQWLPLSDPVTATAATLQLTDPTPPPRQRFYRVVLRP